VKPADFDYDLPAHLIAQRPARPRDAARLLLLPLAREESLRHDTLAALPDALRSGDLLVVNDTRVVAARLRGWKTATGGRIEVLILEEESPRRFRVLARGLGRTPIGTKLSFPAGEASRNESLSAELVARHEDATILLAFEGPCAEDPARLGEMPIPPYIRGGRADASDLDDYQTCFADRPGAVAAPTAGLHFTPRLLDRLDARGVLRARVTLHVGWGTFEALPEEADLSGARLHAERFEVTEDAARAVNAARAEGRRVIAVGTTSARVLESAAAPEGRIATGAGTTDLFIRPGHRFRAVDGLLTNFHLPRSSLLVLVCAMADRDRVLAAYHEAVRLGYRFYSYGDAMLLV
jgi:S-adenosylmethionine:tRNA ribosyltransferase-isomerase